MHQSWCHKTLPFLIAHVQGQYSGAPPPHHITQTPNTTRTFHLNSHLFCWPETSFLHTSFSASSSTVVLGYRNLSAFFLLIHDVLSLKYKFHHLSLLKPFAEIHLSITTPRWLWWKCWNLVTLGSKSGHFGFEIWPQIHEIMKLELKS